MMNRFIRQRKLKSWLLAISLLACVTVPMLISVDLPVVTKNIDMYIDNKGSQMNMDVCGNHGSYLIDTCICDHEYDGVICDRVIPIRNTKCRFDATPDFCRNVRDVGRFRVLTNERKQQAMNCETRFWETTSVPKRNHDQLLVFENFQGLPINLGNVLEIGAGPYTKVKLILEAQPNRRVQHVTLVDPLIDEFLLNPKIATSYTSNRLEVNGIAIPTTLVSAGAENPLRASYYDTVILVNTLEHCSNAVSVLNNVFWSLKPGGILIFGEGITSETQLLLHDACHPIQLVSKFLAKYLKYFDGKPIMPPKFGASVEGVSHEGVKQSMFAILRKGSVLTTAVSRLVEKLPIPRENSGANP